MSISYQKNRNFALTIGDPKTGTGYTIKPPLNIKFKLEKYLDVTSKVNRLNVEIYNLSEKTRSYFEEIEYPTITLQLGYLDTATATVFIGQATSVSSKKESSDIVTTVEASEGFIEMHNVIKPFSVAAGGTVLNIIKGVNAQMQDIAIGTLQGTRINTKLVSGYSADGTPRQIFNELANAYKLQWRIDKNVLYFNDDGGVFTQDAQSLYHFTPDSGLLNIPYRHNYKTGKSVQDGTLLTGVEIEALINPFITAGDLISVQVSKEEPNKVFQIRNIDYEGEYDGNDWKMKALCDEIKQ